MISVAISQTEKEAEEVRLCYCQVYPRIHNQITMTAPLASYWRKVEFQIGTQPKPRHGHRAVTFKNEMVIFGGGNEGIIEEFHVFKNGKYHCNILLDYRLSQNLLLFDIE